MIVANLHQRIVVSGLGGKNKTRTKSELHSAIANAFPQPGYRYAFIKIMKIKKNIEASLVPWVIAEPSAFPELKAMAFVFAHTVPVRSVRALICFGNDSHVLQSIPVVLILLFGSWYNVATLSGSEMWDTTLTALQRRGISEVREFLSYQTGTKTTQGIFRGCQY